MTIAYVCTLIAAFLPYIWTAIAKAGGERYDNRDPRAWLDKHGDARRKRANNAQLNAFEAFPAFAASVLMAQFAGVAHERITWLALAFVVFRILHGLLYIANRDRLRSLVWFGGFACMLALMGMAIAKIA